MFEKVKQILIDELQVEENLITLDAELANDLGINSIELADLVNEALGEEAKDFKGDLNTLTPEQIQKVENLAADKGLIIDKDEGGNTQTHEPVHPDIQQPLCQGGP